MTRFRSKLRHIAGEKGAATVEFACLLPVVLLLMAGGIELGRGVMVRHILEEAARAGCRVAAMNNGSTADVEAIVEEALEAANITDYTIDVQPNPPENLDFFEPVTVTVTTSYSHVSWMSFGFMDGASIQGTCVMPAEGDASSAINTTKKTSKKNSKNNSKNNSKSSSKNNSKNNSKSSSKNNSKNNSKNSSKNNSKNNSKKKKKKKK